MKTQELTFGEGWAEVVEGDTSISLEIAVTVGSDRRVEIFLEPDEAVRLSSALLDAAAEIKVREAQ